MPIAGILTDQTNPPFTKDDFLFWMPQYKNIITDVLFDKFYEIANAKIFKSIFGSDWEYAMSLCIAHYIELYASNASLKPVNDFVNLSGGNNYKGVMNSYSIGAFSKTIDTESTLVNSQESLFWNQTSYGANLMALLKSKPIPNIFVVYQNKNNNF